MLPAYPRHSIRQGLSRHLKRPLFASRRYIQVVGQYQAFPSDVSMGGHLSSGATFAQVALPTNLVITNYTSVLGNPNSQLGYMGSLIDNTRTWRNFIARCIGARFCMSYRTPNLLTSLDFCLWYKVSNACPSSYKVNSTGIKWIAHCLSLIHI